MEDTAVQGVERRYRPFSNGSQFADWELRNCDRCKKHDPDWVWTEASPHPPCELDEAMTLAYIGDGTVSAEEARRLGYLSEHEGRLQTNGGYTWDCTERELREGE